MFEGNAMPSRASNGSIMRSLFGESNRQVAFLPSELPFLSTVLTDCEDSCPTHLCSCEASSGVGRKGALILEKGAAWGAGVHPRARKPKPVGPLSPQFLGLKHREAAGRARTAEVAGRFRQTWESARRENFILCYPNTLPSSPRAAGPQHPELHPQGGRACHIRGHSQGIPRVGECHTTPFSRGTLCLYPRGP